MKSFLKLVVFAISLFVGILYVDYRNNATLGNSEITILKELAEDVTRNLNNISIK